MAHEEPNSLPGDDYWNTIVGMTFRWWAAIFTDKNVWSIWWRSWLQAWNEFLRSAWAHSLSCMMCIFRNGTSAVGCYWGVLGCGSTLSQLRGTVSPVAWGLETSMSGVNQDSAVLVLRISISIMQYLWMGKSSTCWCHLPPYPYGSCGAGGERSSFAASACRQVLC